ncbi:RNA polymerase sigma24 factor [Sporosarcina globispora]|uniref:RNA polymerase sigma24 factor n=1 Tax=Sporosarcina globispora TaxID=1459 RepID=A0A0M0GDL1_SPOGL|nr:RNA polymerase sigma factor SigJ [Sporosarcina globispora]KON87990.1 RNA polymerase sigma24 factor [Sporosarcina globispora]
MQEMYNQYKGLLFKLAYQLTGSASDAEDVVHDVFLKIYDVPTEKLTEPKAYLCKMVTNRCRDIQKSARKKREQYFGEWLPEPLFNSSSNTDSMESVERNDLLSYAMMVLLERLTPAERVVFVLREALGFEFAEIAELIEKSEVNCRKLLSRARAKMGITPEELVHTETTSKEMIYEFLAALKQGNMKQLVSLLDQKVVLVSDGGGKAKAAIFPIETPDRVGRFLLGAIRKASMVEGTSQIEIIQINEQPAFILRCNDGIHTVGIIHTEGNLIRNIYIVRNPDKLKNIGK